MIFYKYNYYQCCEISGDITPQGCQEKKASSVNEPKTTVPISFVAAKCNNSDVQSTLNK